MTPAPITAHMSNFDPIPRLQQIAATIEDGGHLDSPATAAHYINCAIKEIERLRQENATLTAERDEARRSVCEQEAQDCFLMPDKLGKGTIVNTPQMEASRRGWDCYKDHK